MRTIYSNVLNNLEIEKHVFLLLKFIGFVTTVVFVVKRDAFQR